MSSTMSKAEYDDLFDSYVCNTGPNRMTWDEWAEITDLADEIDIGCNFDDAGHCDRARRILCDGGSEDKDHTCCHLCNYSEGYLVRLPVEAVETVKAIFDGGPDGAGFRGPNGCRLPRKWRSVACIAHRCYPENYGKKVWRDWEQLVRFGIDRGKNLTVETVREGLRKNRLLKSGQLVQLVALV